MSKCSITGRPISRAASSRLRSRTNESGRADQSGRPIGDLRYNLATGEASGTAAGGERQLCNQVVAAIMRAYRRLGSAPSTAHAHYY